MLTEEEGGSKTSGLDDTGNEASDFEDGETGKAANGKRGPDSISNS